MKRKYYLRGLGTGILVTALIMMIISGQKDSMTDEEVKARAKELGMVESTLLSELANQTQPETQPEALPPTEEQKTEPETQPEALPPTEEQKTEPETQPETLPPTEEQKTEPETQPETAIPTEEQKQEETMTVVIRSGESSVTVSRALAEAGLVASADAYDSYLCQNGYDKKIRAGSYEIPTGATEEEIAKIITRR